MRWGIDTYSFHRYLGEVYPEQKPANRQYDYVELITELSKLNIDGLSIETCFLDGPDDKRYDVMSELCKENHIEMVLAWGHPFGLYGGSREDAVLDMLSYLNLCDRLGISTMRIVGSNRRLMGTIPKIEQLQGIQHALLRASEVAKEHEVTLAIENHQDFFAHELLEMLEQIGSPFLGVNYDSGNSLRIGEDPIAAVSILGSWIKAVHLKDVAKNNQANASEWIYWACVPAGRGEVDLKTMIATIEGSHFSGIYAIELDYMHPDYPDEMEAIQESLTYLRSLSH